MLIVRIEYHNANTGEVTVIGKMKIANTGAGTLDRDDYRVAVFRRNGKQVVRTGEVKEYPRLAFNVWRLVCRALRSAFPEEKS